MRPPRDDVQHSDGLNDEMKRLYDEASGVVQLALTEKEKYPDRADEIYEEAINRIMHEVLTSGCLGPASGAIDRDQFLEELGDAFGKFEERVITDDLDLSFLVRIARNAARTFDKKEYHIGQRWDNPAGSKATKLKVQMDVDKAMVKLQADGVTMENVTGFEMIEQYFDLFRCKVIWVPEDHRLVVKGRTEFVKQVLGESD